MPLISPSPSPSLEPCPQHSLSPKAQENLLIPDSLVQLTPGSWSSESGVQTGGQSWGWEGAAHAGHDLWKGEPLPVILMCTPLPLCSPPEDHRGRQDPPRPEDAQVTWDARCRVGIEKKKSLF